jgi:hypothetical protein
MPGFLTIRKYDDNGVLWFETIADKRDILHAYNKLGLLMDKSCGVMHKIGDFTKLEKIQQEWDKKYRAQGYNDVADDMVLLDISILPQEEITKVMEISDYCAKIYKQFLQNEINI